MMASNSASVVQGVPFPAAILPQKKINFAEMLTF